MLDTDGSISQNRAQATAEGKSAMAPPQHPAWKNLVVQQGKTLRSAVPTQSVSNEEFAPFGQTADQARVEQIAAAIIEQSAARQGLTRRDFLKTTGGDPLAMLPLLDTR